MKIFYGQRWYRPMEIAKLGLIQNRMGDKATVSGNYDFILNLINSGRISAKNYSRGKVRKNWLVPESEIVRYHNTVSKVKR